MSGQIEGGFLVLSRRLFDGWIGELRPAAFRVLVETLRQARSNPDPDRRWCGWGFVLVRRGELLSSVRAMATACRVSPRCVRSAWDLMAFHGMLTRRATNRFTHISIVDYALYQIPEDRWHTDDTRNDDPDAVFRSKGGRP